MFTASGLARRLAQIVDKLDGIAGRLDEMTTRNLAQPEPVQPPEPVWSPEPMKDMTLGVSGPGVRQWVVVVWTAVQPFDAVTAGPFISIQEARDWGSKFFPERYKIAPVLTPTSPSVTDMIKRGRGE